MTRGRCPLSFAAAPLGATAATAAAVACLACRLACGVYLLHSLPAILFPSGMLASMLTLLAGVLLGLAGAAAALVSSPDLTWRCWYCGIHAGC